jgi:3-deoxy-7-phosphoheptulonate synthase
MSILHHMHLPTPKEIRRHLPLHAKEQTFIAQSRKTVSDILSGKDPRMAVVAGPCSIHDIDAAIAYAEKFKALSKEVEKHCYLVMRAYVEKPRTVTGWKGLLYDPFLDGSNDMCTGIFWTRQLMMELAKMGVPAATEFLDPLAASYTEDLVSWGFIGARTSASQPHREIASLLPMPIGFKNGIEGNIDQAVHGIMSARSPHTFLHIDEEGKLHVAQSEGNEETHLVLRGSNLSPNYDAASVGLTLQKLRSHGIKSRILIDCSHGNCQKEYGRQKDVFYSVLEQIEAGNTQIMGLMLESHLEEGNQFLPENPSSLKYAVSITDPCIDWEMTESLVLAAEAVLSSSRVIRFTQS